MGKIKDETGNKYGSLRVLCEATERTVDRKVQW